MLAAQPSTGKTDLTHEATDSGAGESLRERHKARNRAAILAATLDSFVEFGYSGASASDIAQRADLSTGTFFNYFEDKQQVFQALMEESFAELLERIVAMQVRELPLDDRLRTVLTATFEHVQDNPALHTVVHRNMSLLRQVYDLEPYREALVGLLGDGADDRPGSVDGELLFEALMGMHLEIGQAMLFRENADPAQAAEFVAGMVYGGLERIRSGGAPLDVGSEIAAEARRHWLDQVDEDESSGGARERRKAENHDAILAAARDAFAETGYPDTGVRDIARRAGVAPGTLYNYFADKEAILRALADRYFGEFADDNAYCRSNARSLEELIAGQVRAAYELALREPVMFEMIVRNMSEVWRMMPRIRNLTRMVTELAVDARGLIEQGLMPNIDADYLVVSILGIGFSVGRVVAERDAPDSDPGVKFVTDLFTGGMLHVAGEDPAGPVKPYTRRYERASA